MTVFRNTFSTYRFFLIATLIIMGLMAVIHIHIWPDVQKILIKLVHTKIDNPLLKKMALGVANAQLDKQFMAYTALRWGSVFLNIVAVMLGVLTGMVLVAGDDERGVLSLLLSRPLSRRRILIEKFSAASLMIFLAITPATLALKPLALTIDEQVSLMRLLSASCLFTLFGMFFCALTVHFSISCSRSLTAGGLGALVAVALYALTFWDPLTQLTPFSLTNIKTMQDIFVDLAYTGVELFMWRNLLILVGLIALLMATAVFRFNRKSY